MTNKGESVNKWCISYDNERRNVCDEESSDRPSVVLDKLKSEVLSKMHEDRHFTNYTIIIGIIAFTNFNKS